MTPEVANVLPGWKVASVRDGPLKSRLLGQGTTRAGAGRLECQTTARLGGFQLRSIDSAIDQLVAEPSDPSISKRQVAVAIVYTVVGNATTEPRSVSSGHEADTRPTTAQHDVTTVWTR